MSEETENTGWWTPTKVGFALTALILAGFVFMAWQHKCILLPTEVLECRSNWAWFLDAPPNEIGDTLAGFAGVLAFVWIIITVWLQGYELREQRKELELTRSELKLARQAQEKQLEVMQKQAEIFEDEQRSRAQADAKETLDAALTRIAYKSLELCNLSVTLVSEENRSELTGSASIFSGYDGEENLDFFLQNSHHGAIGCYYLLCNARHRIHEIHRSKKSDALKLLEYFGAVLAMENGLSDGQRVRLDSLRVREIYELLNDLISSKRWWAEE